MNASDGAISDILTLKLLRGLKRVTSNIEKVDYTGIDFPVTVKPYNKIKTQKASASMYLGTKKCNYI